MSFSSLFPLQVLEDFQCSTDSVLLLTLLPGEAAVANQNYIHGYAALTWDRHQSSHLSAGKKVKTHCLSHKCCLVKYQTNIIQCEGYVEKWSTASWSEYCRLPTDLHGGWWQMEKVLHINKLLGTTTGSTGSTSLIRIRWALMYNLGVNPKTAL